MKEYYVRRHYGTKHQTFTSYTGAEREEKVKQMTASLLTQQQFAAPFSVDAEEVEESLQLELIEMQCDDSLKNQHQLLSLLDFYRSLEKAKFPLMRRHAKQMMSLFGSTYICEQTFSLLTLNKSRLRTRMTDSHLRDVLRILTTKLTPDLPAVLQTKAQHHCSH